MRHFSRKYIFSFNSRERLQRTSFLRSRHVVALSLRVDWIKPNMARTGKKSTKTKPSLLKKQITQNRRIQKKSNAKDRGLKDALDKELTSEDIVLKKDGKQSEEKKARKQDEEALLASFDQLRGL